MRAAKADALEKRKDELEKQLERLLGRYKKNEAIPKNQLVLLADAISRGEAGDVLGDDDPRREANELARWGSDAGGERAAIAFTILGCCRIAGVNPIEYLTAMFPILAGRVRLIDLPDLLPHRWKPRRDAAAAFAAALSQLAS